MPLLATAR